MLQNNVAEYVFVWSQGYMSGFNGYSMLIGKGSPFDLGAVSPEASVRIYRFLLSVPPRRIYRQGNSGPSIETIVEALTRRVRAAASAISRRKV
jgi:hypothetical protein